MAQGLLAALVAARLNREIVELSDDRLMVRVWQVARSTRLARCCCEVGGQTGHPGRSQLRIVELDDGAELTRVVGCDPFVGGARPADGGAGLIAELFPFARGARQEQLAQLR